MLLEVRQIYHMMKSEGEGGGDLRVQPPEGSKKCKPTTDNTSPTLEASIDRKFVAFLGRLCCPGQGTSTRRRRTEFS